MARIFFRSVVTSNVGYTLFLLPALGLIYPDSVPLTIPNLAGFVVVDTMAGLLLGVLIYFLMRKTRIGAPYASGVAILLLWLLYWLPVSAVSLDLSILVLDGVAAIITWLAFMALYRSWKGSISKVNDYREEQERVKYS
jgi:hypothetical protein